MQPLKWLESLDRRWIFLTVGLLVLFPLLTIVVAGVLFLLRRPE